MANPVGTEFLGTNVLVYAFHEGDPRKQRIARQLVERGPTEEVVISAQVLAEFANTLLRKTG